MFRLFIHFLFDTYFVRNGQTDTKPNHRRALGIVAGGRHRSEAHERTTADVLSSACNGHSRLVSHLDCVISDYCYLALRKASRFDSTFLFRCIQATLLESLSVRRSVTHSPKIDENACFRTLMIRGYPKKKFRKRELLERRERRHFFGNSIHARFNYRVKRFPKHV